MHLFMDYFASEEIARTRQNRMGESMVLTHHVHMPSGTDTLRSF